MERQARGVHSSRSVSTFASVALVPAHNDQPRRDAATVPTGGDSNLRSSEVRPTKIRFAEVGVGQAGESKVCIGWNDMLKARRS
jgi:hypothetical protein